MCLSDADSSPIKPARLRIIERAIPVRCSNSALVSGPSCLSRSSTAPGQVIGRSCTATYQTTWSTPCVAIRRMALVAAHTADATSAVILLLLTR